MPVSKYIYKRIDKNTPDNPESLGRTWQEYIIGLCEEPRGHPNEWCDKIICAGIIVLYEKQIEKVVEALNASF